MKYIKLFEDRYYHYSVYELITMDANQVFGLFIEEIQKRNPNLELVKDILAYTVVDINSKDSNGWTALMRAVMYGSEKLVELLLKHPRIDVNVQRKDGWTALMLAADWGKGWVVELLLNHPGIDRTLKNKDGDTAWDLAYSNIIQKFPQLNPNFR
jgi:ankyrin repeat protein